MVKPNDNKPRCDIDEPSLRDALARSGHRMTTQRRLIYEAVVHCQGHPTAEDVHRRVKQFAPRVSLATVYNGLESLVEAGAIGKLPRDGMIPARYELRKEVHHHARCIGCDQIWDLEQPAEPLPISQLLGKHRFKPVAARVEVLVECPIKTNTPLGIVPNAVCPLDRSNPFKRRHASQSSKTA